jgi:hypothetical protein
MLRQLLDIPVFKILSLAAGGARIIFYLMRQETHSIQIDFVVILRL